MSEVNGWTPSPVVGVFEGPDDPEEKERWVQDMLRIVIALQIDGGAKCGICGHRYESVDDFLARSPVKGIEDPVVCGDCWDHRGKNGDN